MARAVKINHRNFARLFLTGDGVRQLVARETEQTATRVRGLTADEIVTQPEEGKSRARGYVTRLGSLESEAADGALSKGLG